MGILALTWRSRICCNYPHRIGDSRSRQPPAAPEIARAPTSLACAGICTLKASPTKLNYRNTAEVLAVARAFADDLLPQNDTEEDQAPTVQPMSTGRHGPRPLLIEFPGIVEEAEYVATKLLDANRIGTPWSDMAIVYRRTEIGDKVAAVLERRGIPVLRLRQ